ncbi:MAG: GTP 3',8-cyclase MoaA, partial [Fimbriiglobus sp.]
KVFPAHELLDLLEREIAPLAPAPDYDPRAPAMDFDYADGGGRVGVIASVSRPFCKSCNRVRLTADGKLRNCLFALDETDVKPLLRAAVPDDAGLAAALVASVRAKWAGHDFNTPEYVKPARTMHTIGG